MHECPTAHRTAQRWLAMGFALMLSACAVPSGAPPAGPSALPSAMPAPAPSAPVEPVQVARPAPPATPAPAAPRGDNRRCSDLLQRLQLGEPLQAEDQAFFQRSCR